MISTKNLQLASRATLAVVVLSIMSLQVSAAPAPSGFVSGKSIHVFWQPSYKAPVRVYGVTSTGSSTTTTVSKLEFQLKNVSNQPVYGAVLKVRFFNLLPTGEHITAKIRIGQPFARATDAMNPAAFTLQPNATAVAKLPVKSAAAIDSYITALSGSSAGIASVELVGAALGGGLGWDTGKLVSGPNLVVLDRRVIDPSAAPCGAEYNTEYLEYPTCSGCEFENHVRASANGWDVIRGGRCVFYDDDGIRQSCTIDDLVDCRIQDNPTADNGGSIWDFIQIVYNL